MPLLSLSSSHYHYVLDHDSYSPLEKQASMSWLKSHLSIHLQKEPDTNLDPDMMMETLPDLERAAKNVLDHLVPNSADPVSIVNSAKRLTDPGSTQSKRLRHSVSNLAVQARWFGPQTYIDVKHVSQLLTSALKKKGVQVGKEWSADPILHQANCARFALEVLLANVSMDSTKRAIKNLEGLFPLPFMNDLSESQHKRVIGESSLRKDTFDLALELRTQSLILKLEEDQYKLDFLPEAAIRQHFFDVDAFDEDAFNSSVAPLRGLNIGRFPVSGDFLEQYRDAVCDRYNEILVLISEAGDNTFDIKELKSAYRWQKFVLRAIQWLRKRTQEIAQGLQGQQSVQTVHKEFFADQDRIESATATPRPSATPAVEKRAQLPAATDDGQEGLPQPRAEEQIRDAPKEDERAPVSTAESRGRRKSSKPLVPDYLLSLTLLLTAFKGLPQSRVDSAPYAEAAAPSLDARGYRNPGADRRCCPSRGRREHAVRLRMSVDRLCPLHRSHSGRRRESQTRLLRLRKVLQLCYLRTIISVLMILS
ncbi:MYB DNA-binding domain protein [Aspergillus fumigatus A1163]|uniref:MYB DNA-binding domain protein n=1 Tax=Aspergillus fumigatus (strain CBS 144.89 / FGSC A1163 / CEA10) TaxID=451804 RepID=B0XYT1_ASPFC|nr:MYB DNA-binding domain protein [Aspergillus fumigatus A1163]